VDHRQTAAERPDVRDWCIEEDDVTDVGIVAADVLPDLRLKE
jgi:hypothetical protein